MIPVTNLAFVLIRPKHDRHEYTYSVSPPLAHIPEKLPAQTRGIMSDSAVSAGAPISVGGGRDQLQTSVSRDPAPPSHRCLCHESVIITEFLCRPSTRVFIFTQKKSGKLTSSLHSRVKPRESYQWQSHTANKNVTPAVIFSASKQDDDECVTIDNPSLSLFRVMPDCF